MSTRYSHKAKVISLSNVEKPASLAPCVKRPPVGHANCGEKKARLYIQLSKTNTREHHKVNMAFQIENGTEGKNMKKTLLHLVDRPVDELATASFFFGAGPSP